MSNALKVDLQRVGQQLTNSTRTREQLSKRWQDLRRQVNSLLLSTNVLTSTEALQATIKLDEMTHVERCDYIAITWGKVCLDKALPILQQLEVVESQLAKNET